MSDGVSNYAQPIRHEVARWWVQAGINEAARREYFRCSCGHVMSPSAWGQHLADTHQQSSDDSYSVSDTDHRIIVEYLDRRIAYLEKENASLRVKLEICTAYAKVCAEDLDSPEDTTDEFWARFRAAQDAFLAACGITPTPDDTPEAG